MSSKSRFLENIISLFVLQGANYLLPLITLPYLVRVLGPDKYGLITFAFVFIQYFVAFTDYGFNMTATRQIAIEREDKQRVSEIFSTVMILKFFLMIISLAILTLILLIVPKFREEWQVYLITFLNVVGNFLFPIWYFQGIERMKYITFFNITSKIIVTALIFIFVTKPSDYLLAAFLQSVGPLLAGIISLFVIFRKYPVAIILPKNIHLFKEELRNGRDVFISVMTGNIFGQGGVFITGLIAGQTSAGFYSIAQKIEGAIVGLIHPISQALYPYICNLYIEDKAKYKSIKKKVIFIGTIVGAISSVSLFFSSKIFTKLIAGKFVYELNILIKFYSIILFCTMLNVLLNIFILSMERYDRMRKMYVGASTGFLLFSIPLTYVYGSYGMSTSILLVALFLLINSFRIIKL
ncbi:oligosaccharide flippase family protein [Geobacillus stearothermophilus]|uniref:oligosaccharide flippase family protein n=1 Tax=Geobacillus stearothermophilus TaxID=1422 RepID=UPI003D1EAE5E